MSCVLASSAVGKEQAQTKSVPSFLFAERTTEREAFVMGARLSWGEMLWGATSCLQLQNFSCPYFPGGSTRSRRSARSAPSVAGRQHQEQEEGTQCVTAGGATKNWAVQGGAVIFQTLQVALVSAASCHGNNDVGSP